MSEFQGRLLEFPFIAIDNFTTDNLSCSGFFLSHCHTDHMDGLQSKQFADALRSRQGVHLYCSETTKNLLNCSERTDELTDCVVGIPANQPTLLSFSDSQSIEIPEQETELVVTLLPAGHCVGSVMILFEGAGKTILYTGDFRLCKSELTKISEFHSGTSVRKFHSIYVDTTFCSLKSRTFPSREESKQAIITLIKRALRQGRHAIVHIQCSAKYGYEFILMGIASHFKTKIHIDDYKMKLYSALPQAEEFFTIDKNSTQIHSCYWKKSSCQQSVLPCGITHVGKKAIDVTRIKPSTLFFAYRGSIPDDFVYYDRYRDLYRVVHSMHSSMNEISDFVSYLKPKYIYPTVTPFDAPSILYAYDRLRQFSVDHQASPLSQPLEQAVACEANTPAWHTTHDHTGPWRTALDAKPVKSPGRMKMLYRNLGLETDAEFHPPLRRRRLLDIASKDLNVIQSSSDESNTDDSLCRNNNLTSSSLRESQSSFNDSDVTYYEPAENSEKNDAGFDIPGSPEYSKPNSQDLNELHEKIQQGSLKTTTLVASAEWCETSISQEILDRIE